MDTLELIFLTAVLLGVGNFMSNGRRGVQRVCWLLSTGTFIVYCVSFIMEPESWAVTSLYALLYAALALGIGSVVLSFSHALFSIPYTPRTRIPKPQPKPKEKRLPPQPPTTPPPPPPTVEEMHRAAIELHDRNCSMIDASPIPPEDKEALKKQEADNLTHAIKYLTDQV